MDTPTVPHDGAKAIEPPTTPIEAPAIEGPMTVSIDEAADPGDTTGDVAIHPSLADNGLVMNTPNNEAAVTSVNTDDAAVHASPRGGAPKDTLTEEAVISMDAPTEDAAAIAVAQNDDASATWDAQPTQDDGVAEAKAMDEYATLQEKYDAVVENVNNRAMELRAKGLLQRDTEEAGKARVADIFDRVKTMKSKGFKAYLHVGGTKFSHPGPGDILGMATNDAAISHTVKLLCPKDDYKCLQISHYVQGLTTTILQNKCVGHTDVWSMDIGELTCELLDHDTALEEARKYNPAANNVPPFMLRVTIKSDAASNSIKQVAYRAVRNVHRALDTQLKSLHKAITSKGDIQMLIGMHGDEDAHRLVQMCHVLEAYRIKDRFLDPFDRFFMHAPLAKTLFASQVQMLPERPDPMPGVTKWANKHQHLVHHMYGSVYDALEEVDNATKLPSFSFKTFAHRMWNVANDEKFLLVVDPGAHSSYLPKVGEPCKIRSDAFTFHIELSEEQRKAHDEATINKLLDILDSVPMDKHRVSKIIELAPELTELGENKILGLLPMKTADEIETKEEWEDRVVEFFTQNPVYLQPTTVDSNTAEFEDNDENRWLSACRQDILFPQAGIQMQVFQVSKPIKKQDDGSEPHLVNVFVPMLDRNEREPFQDFVERIKASTFDVSIRKDISNRTLKAESQAVNSLVYPNASDLSITTESVSAYEYLLNFRADPEKVIDILEEIPGLKRLVECKTNTPDPPPRWLLAKHRRLEKRKRKALASFAALPHRVSLIAGVAGSGKSTFSQLVILGGQYGHCPTSTSPQEAPEPDFPVLCIFPNNEGVDKFSTELKNEYEELGLGANAPVILRLYTMDSEIATMLNKGKDKPKDPFDADAAAEHMATFTVADYLMAEYQVVKLTAESFNAEKIARARKNRLRDMSLHAHAFQWLEQNRPRYPELWELLDLVAAKQTLSDVQATSFKARTRLMYEDFLGQFKGIICATPVAASNPSVRDRFKPELVLIDENARMRELSTLILVAWYSPKAWVILGDPRQLKPHLSIDIQRKNTFRRSLETSILSRAAEAGAVVEHFSVNFRQYGDLVKLPSDLCYLGEMVNTHGIKYTPPVDHWISHLQMIHPAHPSLSCRLLVELPGSRTGKMGNSSYNEMHARWVFDRVKKMLGNGNLIGEGKNNGKPARILLLPLYRAQYRQYEVELGKLKSSQEFDEEQLARIRLHTLDSSQGDEEDIVIADLTQTDEPGFTGDLHRICLMLTRPVIGQIILMEKGMWLCSDSNTSIAARASLLRAIYLPMAKDESILTVPCCDRCQSFGDHMTAQCREATRKDGRVDECSKCGDKKTHRGTIETCPMTTCCDNCKEMGHTSNECQSDTMCYRCGEADHICYECVKYIICTVCRSPEHLAFRCPERPERGNVVCNECGETGHVKARCPDRARNVKCHNCKETGHLGKDCPKPRQENRKCKNCDQEGHIKVNCPELVCLKCSQKGHMAPVCPNKRVKTCGEPGHKANTCNAKHPS